MIEALVIIAVLVYGVLHLGHRGARRRGERGLSVSWNSRYRRPYVSIPLPGRLPDRSPAVSGPRVRRGEVSGMRLRDQWPVDSDEDDDDE